MKRLALWLVPAALAAGDVRYARLGEVEGTPEVQLQAASAWSAGVRNTVLLDGAWVRTGAGARAEIEFDDGSAFRMNSGALCELSDYTRLSTGQRVTLVSLDRGVAYFTGAAADRDSLIVALPGAQVTIRRGARVRLEAQDAASQIAVLEGAVLFSSPAAELEIAEGQLVKVEPAYPSRFFLYREIPSLDSDAWSEARDKALVTAPRHVASPRFGLADLDSNGNWIDTAAWGAVWKPKTGAGWAPFRSGKWVWYDGAGYTWISAEPWGWLPYHYGRWVMDENAGWVWVPGQDEVYSPGDVYWLRGAKWAGWGPLAPGEQWDGRSRPQQFLNASSTFAAFVPEMREVDPAGFTPPKEPLLAAAFTAALPSPALTAVRFEARRPVLRAGSTRVIPYLAGVSYGQSAAGVLTGPAGQATAEAGAAAPAVNTTVIQPPPSPPVVIVTPPPEPPEVFYPAPVYSGIVVVNPPERDHNGRGRDRGRGGRREEPPPARTDLRSGEQRHTAPPAPPPAPPARVERPRIDADQRRPVPPPPQTEKPVYKGSEQPRQAPPPKPPEEPKPAEQRVAAPAAERPVPRAESSEQRRPSPR